MAIVGNKAELGNKVSVLKMTKEDQINKIVELENKNQKITDESDSNTLEKVKYCEHSKVIPKAFQQEEFNSSYKERISQTPGENNTLVEFKNKELRGESKCTLKPPPDEELQKIFDKAGIDGIVYRNGVPDFSPVSKLELDGIDMTNGRTGAKGTYAQANNRFADMLNKPTESAAKLAAEFGISPKNGKKFTASDISRYMADNKLTWHELNDLSTVQMVPTKVNSTFGHLGGISEANK